MPARSSAATRATSPAPMRVRGCRLRGPDRAQWTGCSRRCARRCARVSTGATSICPRIGLTRRVLREADLIDCNADEAVASGLTSVFLPHGIGHLLGLEVHDVGGFSARPAGGEIARPAGHPYLRLTRALRKGFVVTMEPGLYFIDQLLEPARADARGSHINWPRVEHCAASVASASRTTWRSRASGCENLTRDAFVRSLTSAWRAGRGSRSTAALRGSARALRRAAGGGGRFSG